MLAAIFILASALGAFSQTAGSAKGKKEIKKTSQATESAAETLKKLFPGINADTVTPTDIKGIYEITSGINVGYFAPDPGYLIIGDIRDKNGVSITAKKREQLQAVQNEAMAAKAKALPLDKAVKIGQGKNTVIEFTDPDCPYCRKASEFFAKKTDITRYVFFTPLPMHPDAENKARYVLCATDKAAAYEEAMTGKLDSKKYEVCKSPEVDALVTLYREQSAKMGVNSTPFFIVNGKAISGADFQRLDQALQQKQ